jgi:CRP-like cAMP-binding protein
VSLLLQALPDAEQSAAAAALAVCPTVALPDRSVRGANRLPEATLLVVEEGVLLVTSARPASTRRMVLAVAGPGSLVLPLSGDERLEAAADSWLTAVTVEAYRVLLALPGAAAAIVDALALELRDRQESLAHFSSVRHVDRVRDKLLQLARTHGRVVRDGVRLDLPLTHELMGEMVGSARETVTWAFGQLALEGFVCRDGRSYRLAVEPEAIVAS